MRKGRLVFIPLFLLLGTAFGLQASQAQTGELYFSQTGHSVAGEFLAFYQSVPHPEEIFGYPITEAYRDRRTNQLIQYFQKARFEYHPTEPPGKQVRLTPLGSYAYTPGNPTLELPDSPACEAFLPENIRVCHAFLDFYRANGGEAIFGRPISPLESHDGLRVQYFTNARFEWRPERPVKHWVKLTDLGQYYFNDQKEDPALLLAATDGDNILAIRELRARAYVQHAVTGQVGSQKVYIFVQDQRLLPIQDVQITLVVHLPGETEKRFIVPEVTNANGLTQYAFDFETEQIGLAEIEVTASLGAIKATTVTSFRIWW